MALVMKNTIPLSFTMPTRLPHTQKTSHVFHIHMHVHINAKVLNFPMQIDKHIVINSCDNQEYIAHPTKGECDDEKKKKPTPTQRKNMMMKRIKPTPRVSKYFY
jgi:hypothetical protein